MSTPAGSYRVLARKYRPSTFDDLIGQEAMVRTLANAFDTGRIPQAWILTGVRGVGKTTTARILARALNYDADGIDKPSIHMPKLGTHCQAIMESRHVDVIEMDAASHNGVDDIRQINDAVRYAPASARYKVYILDEVHMVTAQGFNALLKTLEEPPPHVKFVFATTEIRKVPITVLSRCQRFDLRRVEAGTLVDHLGNICTKEKVEAETDALQLIARAAEGSVRDSLSLMDQAIAHAAGPVRAEDVRQMLGLADRTRVIDLFAALMRGDIAAALSELRDQYDSGADPAVALTDLAEFTHFVTRIKVVPSVADDRSIAEVERSRGAEFAASLSMRVLSMTWQMLLKGIAEVRESSKPIQAAEMVLVRIGYASGLPSPEDLLNGGSVGAPSAPAGGGGAAPSGGGGGQRPRAMSNAQPRAIHAVESSPAIAAPRASAQTAPVRALARFEDVIALATEQRDILMRTALERDVRLVRFEDGRLEIALEPGASKAIVNDLAQKLKNWTGRPWMIVLSSEQGEASLRAKEDARREEVKTGVTADPLVQAVLSRFPGAQIVGVQVRGEAVEQPAFTSPPNEDGDIAPWDDGAPPNEGESFDD
ncbi:DNA polymerase III subunit gamma/tau [Variibacter gotjawalensis]|nr:DNA polymerase III subunit gamma/tau [Variibacter gotjawalensis]NIK47426.1 DNA polymerase-3 subunit gamma/tau [Variibacter gotjawalensis]